MCSCSSPRHVYKGLFSARKLTDFTKTCAMSVSNLRWPSSTSAAEHLPTWSLAHPFRYLAHNRKSTPCAA
ncbi:MAG: hypothetical protein ACLT8E_04620 [Akkermansia sp.]